jgi:hypothetical protein
MCSNRIWLLRQCSDFFGIDFVTKSDFDLVKTVQVVGCLETTQFTFIDNFVVLKSSVL